MTKPNQLSENLKNRNGAISTEHSSPKQRIIGTNVHQVDSYSPPPYNMLTYNLTPLCSLVDP